MKLMKIAGPYTRVVQSNSYSYAYLIGSIKINFVMRVYYTILEFSASPSCMACKSVCSTHMHSIDWGVVKSIINS